MNILQFFPVFLLDFLQWQPLNGFMVEVLSALIKIMECSSPVFSSSGYVQFAQWFLFLPMTARVIMWSDQLCWFRDVNGYVGSGVLVIMLVQGC